MLRSVKAMPACANVHLLEIPVLFLTTVAQTQKTNEETNLQIAVSASIVYLSYFGVEHESIFLFKRLGSS